MPIRVRSSTCRTRKSATSARLIAPNRQSLGVVRTRYLTSCGAVFQKAWSHDGPVEP